MRRSAVIGESFKIGDISVAIDGSEDDIHCLQLGEVAAETVLDITQLSPELQGQAILVTVTRKKDELESNKL